MSNDDPVLAGILRRFLRSNGFLSVGRFVDSDVVESDDWPWRFCIDDDIIVTKDEAVLLQEIMEGADDVPPPVDACPNIYMNGSRLIQVRTNGGWLNVHAGHETMEER